MNTDTRIWFQTANGKRAYIELVNDQYRYEVWELWTDRHGRLEHDGALLSTGSYPTFADAKRQAFTVLA